MEQEILFVRASREAFRFPSPQGDLTVEQLWSLPLQTTINNKASLDNVARRVYDDLQGVTEKSFVNTGTNPAKSALEAKLEIVKFLIATRQAEAEAKVNALQKAEKRQKLMQVLARKQEGKLEEMSEAEILAELQAIDK